MADPVRVQGLAESLASLRRAKDRLPSTITAIMRDSLREAVTFARARYLTGGTTVDRLAVRTGGLRASFDATVVGTGFATIGTIGYIRNPPSWWTVHEGWPDRRASTTIRPTRAQFLAIPLTDEARQAGSPRQYPGTLFAARSRRGNLLLFRRVPGGIEPVYLLRSQVVIPARPALYPTMDILVPHLQRVLAEAGLAVIQGGQEIRVQRLQA